MELGESLNDLDEKYKIVKLIGMNSDLMCQYIEFVADRLLVELRIENDKRGRSLYDR